MAVKDHFKPGLGSRHMVKIVSVDTVSRKIEASLKDFGTIQIAVFDTSSLFVWPKVMETWIVRKENGIWMLDHRVDIGDDQTINSLNPGEAKINADVIKTISGKTVIAIDDSNVTSGQVIGYQNGSWIPINQTGGGGGGGVVNVTSPITYNSTTQTVGIDQTLISINAAQVSGLGSLASKSLISSADINDLTIQNGDIAANTIGVEKLQGTSGTGNVTINSIGAATANYSFGSFTITSTGAITGGSLATSSNGNITANGSGNISTTNGNISTDSGTATIGGASIKVGTGTPGGGTKGTIILESGAGNPYNNTTTIQPSTTNASSRTLTLPETSADDTLVSLTSSGALTNKTINGLTITTSTGTLTIANGKTLTANNSIIFSGTDSTTMTFPSTSATIARTDAGQTFFGVNTFTSPSITTSITSSSATFDVFNGPAAITAFSASTTTAIAGTTSASTTSIASGAITTGTKTVNVGTAGTGGTTAVNIGSSAGSTSTVTLNGGIRNSIYYYSSGNLTDISGTYYTIVYAGSSASTITVPEAGLSNSGRIYNFKLTGTGPLNLTPSGTGTTTSKIDGLSTYTISTKYQSITIQSGPTATSPSSTQYTWYVI